METREIRETYWFSMRFKSRVDKLEELAGLVEVCVEEIECFVLHLAERLLCAGRFRCDSAPPWLPSRLLTVARLLAVRLLRRRRRRRRRHPKRLFRWLLASSKTITINRLSHSGSATQVARSQGLANRGNTKHGIERDLKRITYVFSVEASFPSIDRRLRLDGSVGKDSQIEKVGSTRSTSATSQTNARTRRRMAP